MSGWRNFLFYLVIFAYLFIDFVILRTKTSIEQKKTSKDRFTAVLGYLVIFLAFFLTFPLYKKRILVPSYSETVQGLFSLAGLILGCMAIGLRYAAKKTLGKYFTVRLNIFEDHQLVTLGIYHKIRHPGYLGLILWFISIPLLIAYPFGLVTFSLLPSVFFITRIAIEEKALREKFGEEYERYRKSTYRLIPFIW